MSPVEWIENLLHGVDPVWALFILSWIIGLICIFALMKAAGRDRRRADYYHNLVVGEINRAMQQANSAGPQITAKTLTEDQISTVIEATISHEWMMDAHAIEGIKTLSKQLQTILSKEETTE